MTLISIDIFSVLPYSEIGFINKSGTLLYRHLLLSENIVRKSRKIGIITESIK